MSSGAVLVRTAAAAAAIAGLGILHATAAGATVVAGLWLVAPELVDADGMPEAAAQAVAFGLACLRVPLEAGDVRGTFAPLTGLALTLWGLVSATRKLLPGWPGGRPAQVVAVAGAFAAVC
ncbi:MAG: hypothetical protein M3279_01810, partial [Actinomycetota bacterium]|nr:hypothetical protein [Actinomycetota bacterium]